MAQESESGDGDSVRRGPGGGVGRRRRSSGDTEAQVRAVKAALMETLGTHERLITYLQAVLLWEKKLHSLLLYILTNCSFW